MGAMNPGDLGPAGVGEGELCGEGGDLAPDLCKTFFCVTVGRPSQKSHCV